MKGGDNRQEGQGGGRKGGGDGRKEEDRPRELNSPTGRGRRGRVTDSTVEDLSSRGFNQGFSTRMND